MWKILSMQRSISLAAQQLPCLQRGHSQQQSTHSMVSMGCAILEGSSLSRCWYRPGHRLRRHCFQVWAWQAQQSFAAYMGNPRADDISSVHIS